MYLAPSHVSRRLFECDKRLEWVNHSPVGDKWVMTDPHKPLKFQINNPLSRIRHRKPNTRGRMCSENLFIFGGKDLYFETEFVVWNGGHIEHFCAVFIKGNYLRWFVRGITGTLPQIPSFEGLQKTDSRIKGPRSRKTSKCSFRKVAVSYGFWSTRLPNSICFLLMPIFDIYNVYFHFTFVHFYYFRWVTNSECLLR